MGWKSKGKADPRGESKDSPLMVHVGIRWQSLSDAPSEPRKKPSRDIGVQGNYKRPIPVSQLLNRQRDTVKIGNTLMVDGMPHIECGNPDCKALVRQHDSKKITLGRWVDEEDIIEDWNGHVIEIQAKRVPRLRQVEGCNDCWNLQNRERQNRAYAERNRHPRDNPKPFSQLVFFDITKRGRGRG